MMACVFVLLTYVQPYLRLRLRFRFKFVFFLVAGLLLVKPIVHLAQLPISDGVVLEILGITGLLLFAIFLFVEFGRFGRR